MTDRGEWRILVLKKNLGKLTGGLPMEVVLPLREEETSKDTHVLHRDQIFLLRGIFKIRDTLGKAFRMELPKLDNWPDRGWGRCVRRVKTKENRAIRVNGSKRGFVKDRITLSIVEKGETFPRNIRWPNLRNQNIEWKLHEILDRARAAVITENPDPGSRRVPKRKRGE
jgi:hypothetical protein